MIARFNNRLCYIDLFSSAWSMENLVYIGRCGIDIRTEAVIHAYIFLVLSTNPSPGPIKPPIKIQSDQDFEQ